MTEAIKGSSSDPVSFDTEPIPSTHIYSEIRWIIPGWVGRMQQKEPETYAEYLWRERTEELNPSDLETEVCNVHQDFADALAMNHFALSFCPKCGEKL